MEERALHMRGCLLHQGQRCHATAAATQPPARRIHSGIARSPRPASTAISARRGASAPRAFGGDLKKQAAEWRDEIEASDRLRMEHDLLTDEQVCWWHRAAGFGRPCLPQRPHQHCCMERDASTWQPPPSHGSACPCTPPAGNHRPDTLTMVGQWPVGGPSAVACMGRTLTQQPVPEVTRSRRHGNAPPSPPGPQPALTPHTQVDDLVDAAADLISMIDELRPLDRSTFNAAYEIWHAIAAVPPSERGRLLDEIEPGQCAHHTFQHLGYSADGRLVLGGALPAACGVRGALAAVPPSVLGRPGACSSSRPAYCKWCDHPLSRPHCQTFRAPRHCYHPSHTCHCRRGAQPVEVQHGALCAGWRTQP